MPTSPFVFDATTFTEQIETLLAQLPGDSPLLQEIRDSANQLISKISEAVTYLSFKEDDAQERLQRIAEIVGLSESSARLEGKSLDPTLQTIKQLLAKPMLVTEQPSPSSVSGTDIIRPLEENSGPLNMSAPDKPRHEAEVPVQKKRGKKSSASAPAKTEADYREYCWELATLSGNTAERKIEREIKNWDGKPYDSPRPGDLILHGSAFTPASEDFPPAWIGPLQEIRLLTEVVNQMDSFNLNAEGHLWLSFTDLFAEASYNPHLKQPQWCLDQGGTLPLWYRWHDLLGWALMTPDFDTFVNNKPEKLSQQREAICQTLLGHHKSLVAVLEKQDEYYISRNLHKVYSSFFQFLSPDDLDANKVPQHLFYRLREAVREYVGPWRNFLQIEEQHPAGVVTSPEYLSDVRDETEKNTSLPVQHPFLTDCRVTESQVLYWLRPKWRLTKTSQMSSGVVVESKLPGSVLYCFG